MEAMILKQRRGAKKMRLLSSSSSSCGVGVPVSAMNASSLFDDFERLIAFVLGRSRTNIIEICIEVANHKIWNLLWHITVPLVGTRQ